jgi:two-component sensor histidine kinase
MALIHEILYDSGDLSKIDLKNYVSRLASGLTRMYGADTGRVRLAVESATISLGIDDMVPCGLAISELISNSLKYAFPDGRDGRIDIRVNKAPDGEIEMIVGDDGVGLPEDLDYRNTNTMGMGLVVSLVERQLGGRLELDRTEGTRFKIVIPCSPGNAG